MEIKITRRRKLFEVCNSMTHSFYYEVMGRIINDSRTKYKLFNFVVSFDVLDILEHLEKDFYTAQDMKEYINDYACGVFDLIKDFDNTKDFYDYCAKTIERYNSGV